MFPEKVLVNCGDSYDSMDNSMGERVGLGEGMADPGLTYEDTHEGAVYPCGDKDYFAPAGPGVRLYFYGGSHDNTRVVVDRCGEFLLGRAEEAVFRFSDRNRTDARVSRSHARLRVGREGVTLVNLSPRNGLMLNGVPLADFQEERLNDTDVISLGLNGPTIRIRIGPLERLSSDV